MSENGGHGTLVIVTSFLVAMLLTALPMPEWAALWRPAWVALVLIYWCLALPARVGVLVAWLVGVFLDVLTGTLMGQHALALSVIAYVAHTSHRRIRVLPLWQQALSVFVLLFFHQVLILWINGIQGLPVAGLAFVASPLLSMMLWPWVFVLLRDVRRRYQVA